MQPVTSALPQARLIAGRATFFIPGFAIAAWAPLVPVVKTAAALDEATLGLALLCLGAGALLAMPLAGALTARHGCRAALMLSVVLIAATLPLLPHARMAGSLGLLLFLFGVGNGAMDCAMNIQAVLDERDSARPMMSGFHAFYSIGGCAGVAAMTALFTLGLSAASASMVAAMSVLVLAAWHCRQWRTDQAGQDTPALVWPRGPVILVGLLCFIAFLAEGVILDWSAVFLHEVRDIPTAHAGLGYAMFTLAMTVARLFGDRWVSYIGRERALAWGAACASVGIVVATMVPTWPLPLLGYALVGLGCANIVPVLFSLAGEQRAMPTSLAIAAVATVGYAGVLAGPALIGFIAQVTSLPVAFLVVGGMVLSLAAAPRFLGMGRR